MWRAKRSKAGVEGCQTDKQVLLVPVEFRGHDVICWKPQYRKTEMPNRSLSRIDLFEELFIERDKYQRSKNKSMTNKPIVASGYRIQINDFDDDVQSWCVEQFANLWKMELLRWRRNFSRKMAQLDLF